MNIKNLVLTMALVVTCLIVIVDYIYLQHKTRNVFVQLQAVITTKNNLDADWGRLQIEHAYHVNNNKIEAQAKTQLGMKLPQKEHILSINR